VDEYTALHQECRVVGGWDYVIEVMYVTKKCFTYETSLLPAECSIAQV
jgi:hypothetical protein